MATQPGESDEANEGQEGNQASPQRGGCSQVTWQLGRVHSRE